MISLIIILLVLLYSVDNAYCFHSKVMNIKRSNIYSISSNSNSNNKDVSIKTNILIIPLILTSIFTPNIAFAKVYYYQ